MAINKFMRTALKAISYTDPDVKKNYKIERKIVNATHHHYLKPLKPSYKTWNHAVTLDNHEIPVRIFSPMEQGVYPIILYFHGGGWVKGNIDSYDKVCSNMSVITNHIVISVDYRLAPEHPFPAAPEDCYQVARELFLNSKLMNVNPEQITIMGDSAGGNLAAVVSLMARDRGEFLPSRQILLYPATNNDHSNKSPFSSISENGTDYLLTSKRVCDYMELYVGNRDNLYNPYFAPLISRNLRNQPKTLIITAEFDPLRDEGEAYGWKLKQGGNKVEIHRIPDALHGFFSLPTTFPQVKKSYKYINRFLSEVLESES